MNIIYRIECNFRKGGEYLWRDKIFQLLNIINIIKLSTFKDFLFFIFTYYNQIKPKITYQPLHPLRDGEAYYQVFTTFIRISLSDCRVIAC